MVEIETLELRSFGIGVTDYMAPSHEQLRRGLVLLVQAALPPTEPSLDKATGLGDLLEMIDERRLGSNLRDPKHLAIAQATDALLALADFETLAASFQERDGSRDKFTLSDESALQQAENCFHRLQRAARHMNRLLPPEETIQIEFAGGTVTNKAGAAHGTAAAHETQDRIHHFGFLSPEQRNLLQGPGLKIEAPEEGNKPFPKKSSFILSGPNGKLVLKKPERDLPEAIQQEAEKLKTFIGRKGAAVFVVEASLASPGKMTVDVFEDTLAAIHRREDPTITVLALPTNPELVVPADNSDNEVARTERNRGVIERGLRYPGCLLITGNDAELHMFPGPLDKVTVEIGYDNIQMLLCEKVRQQRYDPSLAQIDPLALISRGKDGVDIITPTRKYHVAVPEKIAPEKIVDTTGAGDALTGTFTELWRHAIEEKLRENPTERVTFSEQELREMAIIAQKVAGKVIQQQGARLPAGTIREVMAEHRGKEATIERYSGPKGSGAERGL